MIILDTNLVSDWQKHELPVTKWFNSQKIEKLYLTTVTVAELRAGVAYLPTGKRKSSMETDLEQRVLPKFAGRILPFGEEASIAYAKIMARAKLLGLKINCPDNLIAAIAASKSMKVATRDIRPFTAAGLEVINPWHELPPDTTPHSVGKALPSHLRSTGSFYESGLRS